jgi:hypothetical protein
MNWKFSLHRIRITAGELMNMATFNLYPYNTYILYAALILLIIYGIILVIHLSKLAQAIKAKQPVFEEIQKNSELAQRKASAVKAKSDQDAKKLKQSLPVLLLVWSIFQNYQQNKKDGERGRRGLHDATAKAFKERSQEDRFIRSVKRSMGI